MKYLTSHKLLTKLTDVGRHVSFERRRSPRGRLFLALLSIAALICVATFSAYRIWERAVPLRAPDAAPRSPSRASPGDRSTTVTLALTVTGPACQVFVRVPGGDILVDRDLPRGQSVRLDERLLSVVLGDASAARVYVNGTLRPPGRPGQRVAFVAEKN